MRSADEELIEPCGDDCDCPSPMWDHLLIPDYDPNEEERYPGDIKPGRYNLAAVVALLRRHKNDPDAIQFIADMLEE
jgi:hypothetical protein